MSLLFLTFTLRGVSNKHCLLSLFLFSAVFHLILFILEGNDDMHDGSEEFEIQPDPTTECIVSCP